MIPKISRGSDPAGLVKYLFGKGRHNEHANQHLVACSDDLCLSSNKSACRHQLI